jgi:2-C-methyl-D-erythritol 4-phosphate cytidylyltransferase
MRTVAIVPAAGCGKRLGIKTKKPFVKLDRKPLVSYALAVLDKSPSIDGIIIASERTCVGSFRRLVKTFRFRKVKEIVVGGRTREESVRNCLKKVSHSYDMVLVHDAARPFLTESIIRKSISLAERYGSCVVGVNESDTVKLVDKDMFIKETLDRGRIFRAQTPQVFRRSILDKAYARAPTKGSTDDSSLVESAGLKVKMLEGSYRNIKITTKEDLKIAKGFLCA